MKTVKKVMLSAGSILLATGVSAQEAATFLQETESQISTLGGSVYRIVVMILGISALVSLIKVGIGLYSSDRDATEKALAWTAGIIFCLVAAIVLKNFMSI